MHILIAVPAYSGQVHLGTMRSLLTDIITLHDRGDKVSVFDESGSAIIADTREQMLAEFLQCGAERIVMVDTDVMWQAGALVRLVDHKVDCVAGIYPRRCDPIDFPLLPLDGGEERDGLLEVEAVPAGFLCCSRAMIDKMVAAFPETEYVSDKFPTRPAYALFESILTDGKKLGEDYSFCRRWRSIGGRIWVDPDIMMAHMGVKAFIGRLGDLGKEG